MRALLHHAKRHAGSSCAVILIVGTVCLTPSYGHAKWWSWFGGLLTTAAKAAALLGQPTAAGVLYVGEIIAVVLDPILPDPVKPPGAVDPEPPSYPPTDPTVPSQANPPLPLPGGAGDEVAAAGNDLIGAANTLVADTRAGASAATLAEDRRRVGLAFAGIADSLVATGVAFSITQADIAATQAEIAVSGLPSFEADYLRSAGASAANISALGSYTATIPLNLAVPSITVDELLRQTATAFAVPEPASFALVAAGLLGAGALRLRQR